MEQSMDESQISIERCNCPTGIDKSRKFSKLESFHKDSDIITDMILSFFGLDEDTAREI